MDEQVEAPGATHLTPKGQATRDRIVAVAARLMYAQGVAETSTVEVQEAAGVSPSQLYHYFEDKKALVRAVVAHQTVGVLGVHVPMLSRLDSIEGLEAWRDFVVDGQKKRRCQGGCPMGSLSSELAELDTGARAELAEGFAKWEGAIRDGLHSMHDRGDLGPDADPDTLALALLAAVQGGLLLTQARRDTAALEAALGSMIELVRSHCVQPERSGKRPRASR
jgi:TetR/AcrR family transcriptional regulator, transcriptional repressor for nem operon